MVKYFCRKIKTSGQACVRSTVISCHTETKYELFSMDMTEVVTHQQELHSHIGLFAPHCQNNITSPIGVGISPQNVISMFACVEMHYMRQLYHSRTGFI